MKFKVGDKVKIVDEVKNLALETPFGTVIIDKNSYPWLKKWLGKVVTIDTAHDGYYTTLEIKGYYLNDEMIEGLVEDVNVSEFKHTQDEIMKMLLQGAINLPEGYQFVDEDGNVINATKIVLEKKKKEYPKTYEECCKVLGIDVRDLDILDNMLDTSEIIYRKNLDRLLNSFRKLLVCRDAYWKIAGEEMGLGKPWKPSGNEDCFIISRSCGEVFLFESAGDCEPFEFPTREMRDAFKENFDPDIEICKEFL